MPLAAIPLLTRRYVVALATVALLAVVGQGAIQWTLSDQVEEGRVINLAGRQRMLSQRAAKEALAAVAAPDAAARAAHADELRQALAVWTRTQRGLREGDVGLGLPGRNSARVDAMLAALDADAARLGDAAGRALGALDRSDVAGAGGAVADLLDAERAYLPQMNAVVFQYDAESAAAVRRLRVVEGGLLALTLVVLLLEGLFVFRPVVARVRTAFRRLERANAELADANAALVVAREEAGAAERTKAAILANMSHEVRTPLTGILGFVDLLRAEAGGQFDDLVDPIERGGLRLLNALDAVLHLARLEDGVLPDEGGGVDVGEEAAGVVAYLRPQAEAKGLSLALDVAPGAEVRADRAAFNRALANVVDNAVRFTERGGVTVRVRPAGAGGVVEVEDTGPGIAPAFLPRVFEAFEQASSGHGRSHEGVGLGLAATGRLMRSMGGEASVRSRLGEGTVVTLRLPAAPPAAAPPGRVADREEAVA